MTRKVEVLVDGDSRGFNSSIDQASGKVTGFGTIVKGVGLGIGAGLVGLAAGGVSELIGKLGEASTAFQEDAASAAKLQQALENNIPAWDGNSDAIEARIAAQMRLGFSDDEQRDSLALLAGSLHNVEDAQAAQSAAMDLARLKGIDLAAATDIIQKASMGQMRGLKSVGIELDANASLTEILGAVTAVAGGQAEAFAEGPMGKQQAAQLKVGEAMEKLGGAVNQVASVLLPIAAEAFTVLIDVIMEVWTAIQPVVQELITALAPAFKTIVGILQGTVIPVFRTIVSTVLPPLISWIKILATITSTAFGVIGNVVSVAGAVIGRVLGAAQAPIKAIGSAFTTVVTTIKSAINGVITFLSGLGSRISGAVRNMWTGVWTAFKSVINMVIRGWNSISFTLPKVDIPFVGTFGGFTVGTPNIPYLHQGGIVPGVPGADVPAILQAGERVTPVKDVGRSGVTINIESFIGSDRDIDRFADKVAYRLRTA